MTETEHRIVFDSLGAYALGALPESERAMVAAHIEHCPICADDADSLERAAIHLTDGVPELQPSPELRNRIMAVVESEAELLRAASGERTPARAPRRSFAMPVLLRWTATAAALLVLGGVAGTAIFNGSDGTDTRTLAADVGRGHAWVEVSDDKAHLVVDGMATPKAGKVYELWIQSGNAAPRPASDDLSRAVFVVGSGRVDIPARLQEGDRVMVTEEPPGGSRIPSAAPIVITNRV